jgi:hypothetical protein
MPLFFFFLFSGLDLRSYSIPIRLTSVQFSLSIFVATLLLCFIFSGWLLFVWLLVIILHALMRYENLPLIACFFLKHKQMTHFLFRVFRFSMDGCFIRKPNIKTQMTNFLDRFRGTNLGATAKIAFEEMELSQEDEEEMNRRQDTKETIERYHSTRDSIVNKYRRNNDKNA